jgi:hypothetical protein
MKIRRAHDRRQNILSLLREFARVVRGHDIVNSLLMELVCRSRGDLQVKTAGSDECGREILPRIGNITGFNTSSSATLACAYNYSPRALRFSLYTV